MYTDMFNYIFHSGSNKVFVVNVSKITTFNKDVLDREWTLASHTFRLVTTSQEIRMCEASVKMKHILKLVSQYQ